MPRLLELLTLLLFQIWFGGYLVTLHSNITWLMKRRNEKLDYSILHSTGKKFYKNQEDQLEGTSREMEALVVQVETISEDIDDFMDENPTDVIGVMV